VIQGLGEALQEIAIYDDDGQLITGTMMDYAVPRASQMPHLELDHTVTPSPVNPLGIKGCGEAGTIGSAACLVNAVCDALAPLGIEHIDKPLTPARVWAAIQAARGGGEHPVVEPGASAADAQIVPGAVGQGKENLR
jgi:carbon-monoxide dehydrogenase large subunit